MAESIPPVGWPPKRLAALVLTLGPVATSAYSLSQGIIGTLPVLAMGVVLGSMYVWRGGSLPDWGYRLSNRRGRGTSPPTTTRPTSRSGSTCRSCSA